MTLAAYMLENDMTDGNLAACLGVSDELVRLWRHGRRPISAKRAIEISKVTGIPRHQLRPDLWDAPDPSPPTADETPKPRAKRTRKPAPESESAPPPRNEEAAD
jgi:plasmid maintenance system antidote protein VapI